MSNNTKATLSILVVVIVGILIISAYQYADFMVKKQESLIESFYNNEEIYCSNDSKWVLISKSQDWKLVGYHFIKDDLAFDFGNCEKNNKVAKNADPKRN